ncbi:MAG: type II secretion system F family protein [Renibacterium salmoninarum]|jgi:tight adherence protein B|nr:type II secretion system F family protein [Renibacterium salmoninarum]
MNPFLLALMIAGALTGILLLVLAFFPKPERLNRPGSKLSVELKRRLARVGKRQRIIFGVGVVAGIIAALVSGSLVTIILVPVGFVVVPWLLTYREGAADIKKLDALESWARNLSGLTQVGTDLERAIRFSLPTTPPVLQPHVQLLIARLNSNFDTQVALDMFADDLDDATADILIGSLKLTALRRTGALSASLTSLANTVSDDVAARREVEAERAQPRQIARLITILSSVMLLGLFFNGTYMAPYSSPTGQLTLTVLVVVFFLGLFWLKRIGQGKKIIRVLQPSGGQS